MRLLPHTIYLKALRGQKMIRGRPLVSKAEARTSLCRLTGQDFGEDAEQWAEWIKAHRKGLYKPK